MNKTQILLRKLDSGELENLAFDLLRRVHTDWVNFVHRGILEGTSKTRKGVPDIYCYTHDNNLVYISVTSDSSKNKIFNDLLKSINKLKKIDKANNSICIAFLNFEPKDEEIDECIKLCKENNSKFIFYNNSKVSRMLDSYEFQDLRNKYLKIPESNIYSVERFMERLERKSKKLPFSNKFVGRNREIYELVLKVKEGNKVIVIYGNPGIGKTRFSIEFAKKLNSDNRYKKFKVLIVDSNLKELNSSIREEISDNGNFILVVDDANRFEDLNDLKDLILNPITKSKPIIILNTRGYGFKEVVNRIKPWDIGKIGEFYLNKLSNAEIDKILKDEPFNINSQVQRRNIVINVKGNPRLAAIMAETLRIGGKPNFGKPFSIFKEYYEGVFSELIESLDRSVYHGKSLLALISTLRHINIRDRDLVEKIVNFLKFDGITHFNTTIEELHYYEIIEITNSGFVKIFDDGISEYIFFNYCLNDYNPVISVDSSFEQFKRTHSNLIIENLVSISHKGYKSKEMTKQFKLLLKETLEVLKSSQDKYKKVQYLEWMNKYAYEYPIGSYNILTRYWNNYKVKISESEALAIIKICESIYWKIFKTHSEGIVYLLTGIYLSENFDFKKIESEIFKTIENIFSYLPPQDMENGRFYWFFKIQEIILSIIDKKIKKPIQARELDLIIKILSLLCYSYFTHTYSDYIDNNKFTLTSGSLEISDALKNLRKNAFRYLVEIYLKMANTNQKMKIIEALTKPFEKLVPFGHKISQELRNFDSRQILVVIEDVCGSEINLILRSKIFYLLKLADRSKKNIQSDKLIKVINDEQLEEFMKVNGTYWRSIYPNYGYKQIEKLKDEFIFDFISKISLSNIKEYLVKISEYQKLITINGKNHEILIGKMFFDLCKANPRIGENIVDTLYSNNEFSNLKKYLFNILAGIAVIAPGIRKKLSNIIIKKGDLEECRAVASSFVYGLERKIEDVKILKELLEKKDNIIDEILIVALKKYEEVDKKWVKNSLILISKRCDDNVFSQLLYNIVPKDNSNYTVFKEDYKSFKEIVFETIKFGNINRFEHALSLCLQHIMSLQGLNGVKEYFLNRIRIKNKSTTKSYPRFDDFNYKSFSFINESKDMKSFYKDLLDNSLDESIKPDILDLIVGLVGDLKKEEFKDVFVQWADDNKKRLKIILYLLRELQPNDIWFDIISEILDKDINSEDVNLLKKSFSVSQVRSGPLSDYYKEKLELVNNAKKNYKSEKMKYFLDLVSDHLEEEIKDRIEIEKEREEFYNAL